MRTGPDSPSPFHVFYMDRDFLILRKPAGIHVHPSPLSPGEASVLGTLEAWLGSQAFPLHRLDRPASGPLAFALNREAAQAGCGLFRTREVKKSYQVVVRGWLDHELSDDSPVLMDGQGEGECRTVFVPLARYLVPEPAGTFSHMRLSLMEVSMEGGRRHQIRIHAARLAHPVLGDTGHGCRHHNHAMLRLWPHGRLQLACIHLGFTHPFAEKEIMINDDPCLHPGWLGRELEGYRL